MMTHSDADLYDFIIIGAGSSGCVLADRLSASGEHRVLLIEAGGRNDTELVNMPRAFMKMFGNPTHFWHYPIRAQEGRPAGEVWPNGRGLGGSSSTNGTWYLRGMPADYDGWARLAGDEWRWSEIERCFGEMESYREEGADPSRGNSGPLQVTQLPYRSPVIAASIQAGVQFGLPELSDINTPGTVGIGYTQATVTRGGRRASSYRAFLKPAMHRPNLTVMVDTHVEALLITGDRVTGVQATTTDTSRPIQLREGGEVLVSAGAIQSPKLLQLSGIGPKEVLERAGVPVRHALDAVGRNLADHAMFSMSFRLQGDRGVNHEFSGWRIATHTLKYYATGKGLMAYTSPEVTALLSLDGSDDWPDVQLGMGPFSMRSSEDMKADPGRGALEDKPGFTINGIALRPKSRGSVAIRSADPADLPEIHANWWGDPADKQFLVRMARLIREFVRQPTLAKFIREETVPGAEKQSDEQLAEALGWLSSPGIHATGTCRMGNPGDSVVDGRLRVHGIKGVRVVDCSVIPVLPAANTNGPAMVIGWRAAELILEDVAQRKVSDPALQRLA